MRILVCGGRDYRNERVVRSFLSDFHAANVITLLVHGAAGNKKVIGSAPLPGAPPYWRVHEGADLLAEEWAIYNRVPFWPYPVTDEEWKTLGKKAGPVRNQRMLDERRPEVIVAFPGGRGTEDMVRRAGSIPIIRVPDDYTVNKP